ncbi:MAG: glycosyltransferase family 1 protein [Anaerolineae bacterium]|nr:glycosyltransferase family 1 protein [Anaerolineae bacterium]
MEVYADRLVHGLRKVAPGSEFVEVRVPSWTLPNWRVHMPYGRTASLRTLGLYLSRLVRYPLALRRVNADVYHILDNSYGHLAFFLDPKRTIVTSHGGTPNSWRQWNPEGLAMWMFDLAFKGMLRASRILVVSEYAKKELLAEVSYPAKRIRVVYHGVDDRFRPIGEDERQRVRAQYLRSNEQTLLLHIGHCATRKNIEGLLRALALLKHRGIDARLLQVGGTFSSAQRNLITSEGISGAITQITYIPNTELPSLYAAADLFVFPSLYEGFGIPLIEAMACGTPIVCSDCELFREVCGDAALFADPRNPQSIANAIVKVILDRALAEHLRQRGLERVKRFTWEQAARETYEVYQKVFLEVAP